MSLDSNSSDRRINHITDCCHTIDCRIIDCHTIGCHIAGFSNFDHIVGCCNFGCRIANCHRHLNHNCNRSFDYNFADFDHIGNLDCNFDHTANHIVADRTASSSHNSVGHMLMATTD